MNEASKMKRENRKDSYGTQMDRWQAKDSLGTFGLIFIDSTSTHTEICLFG